MSTTYTVKDPKYSEQRLCTICATGLGTMGAIMDVPLEVIERYPDDTKLSKDNGDGAVNVGELKAVLEDCVKVDYKTSLEFNREDIKRILNRMPDVIQFPDGKKYNFKGLKEIVNTPGSDLRDLFK